MRRALVRCEGMPTPQETFDIVARHLLAHDPALEGRSLSESSEPSSWDVRNRLEAVAILLKLSTQVLDEAGKPE